MPDTGSSNPFVAVARKRGAYTSEDMTDDAIAVLDALGWKRAHLFGASLGGIIAQRIALRHPDRVLSVVSSAGIPSDISGSAVAATCGSECWPDWRGTRFPRAATATSSVARARPRRRVAAYPFDETATREWIEREVDSGPRDTRGAEQAGRRAVARPAAARAAQADPGPARRPDPLLRVSGPEGHRQRRPGRPPGHVPRRRSRHSRPRGGPPSHGRCVSWPPGHRKCHGGLTDGIGRLFAPGMGAAGFTQAARASWWLTGWVMNSCPKGSVQVATPSRVMLTCHLVRCFIRW